MPLSTLLWLYWNRSRPWARPLVPGLAAKHLPLDNAIVNDNSLGNRVAPEPQHDVVAIVLGDLREELLLLHQPPLNSPQLSRVHVLEILPGLIKLVLHPTQHLAELGVHLGRDFDALGLQHRRQLVNVVRD